MAGIKRRAKLPFLQLKISVFCSLSLKNNTIKLYSVHNISYIPFNLYMSTVLTELSLSLSQSLSISLSRFLSQSLYAKKQ